MLDAIAAFGGLSAAERTRLSAVSTRIEPRDGAVIFQQGDPADAVFAITAGDGFVRIGASDRHSKSLMVELFRAGDIFGEMGVIDGNERSAEAVAEGRVQLARIPAGAFMEAVGTNPALGLALCRLMAQRLRRTFDLFQDATFEPLEARLARQLLYLAERGSRKVEGGVRLAGRFRQGDLADLLGTTTRSIITILNAWRARGIVAYDTERAMLTLCDVDGLRALIDAE